MGQIYVFISYYRKDYQDEFKQVKKNSYATKIKELRKIWES